MYSKTNHWYEATNLSLACLLLPRDPEHKAGNMSSWWGPTWISVRCRGKKEWTSSPVGSAQTQRRAQMKSPTSATPTHPCQVKTIPSDVYPADRQTGSSHASYYAPPVRGPARQPTFLSALRDLILSEISTFVYSFSFGLQSLSPRPRVAPVSSILPPPAQRGALASTAPPPVDDRGQAFPGACLSVLSPSQWGGNDLEEACPGFV